MSRNHKIDLPRYNSAPELKGQLMQCDMGMYPMIYFTNLHPGQPICCDCARKIDEDKKDLNSSAKLVAPPTMTKALPAITATK